MTRMLISSEPLAERRGWDGGGREPPLCEVLADPIVAALMRCDGVTPAALGSIIADARHRLRQSPRTRSSGRDHER